MRPAVGRHVLADLRAKLNKLQKELADYVGLSRRTIQDIERGVLPLSRRNAVRISEKTGVSVEWLLANDRSRPITNISGKPWNPRDQRWFTTLSQGMGQDRMAILRPILAAGVLPLLLQDYLRQRVFFERLNPRNPQAIFRWSERKAEAWRDFISSDPNLAEYSQDQPRDLNVESLNSIRDDLEVIEDFLLLLEKVSVPK
jgi:transcriptional regulator with XRE-family HTH domain